MVALSSGEHTAPISPAATVGRVQWPKVWSGWGVPSRYRRQLQALRAHTEALALPPTRQWRAQAAGQAVDSAYGIEACAAVDAACRQVLGLIPFDNQWLAALAMMDGRLVEMATGEGKTLAAGLAAAVTALCGQRVHVITANDYLVERDALWLAPVYAALGLRVASVAEGDDETRRRDAYRAEVVYATARTVVFDALRDEVAGHGEGGALGRSARCLTDANMAGPVLTPLDVVFIDEADSILIDEARVPLVLSAAIDSPQGRVRAWQAWSLSASLTEGTHFKLTHAARQAVLTAAGQQRIVSPAGHTDAAWVNEAHRREWIETALVARHLVHRGTDYVLRDGEVCIVDPLTGRIAEGRVWSRGLHALIALKEGVKLPPETHTVAQTTYQRFFPRYARLGGMSGTIHEVHRELASVYGCQAMRVPLRRPSRRKQSPARLFLDDASLAQALIGRVGALIDAGRPVLIGTDSVVHSVAVSAMLQSAGIAHQVLNADQDQHEAEVIENGAQPGAVTVATNMAGRGTDIRLMAGVAERGGLHVLSLQLNRSARLDRQLAGRGARQGDPGSVDHWLHFALMKSNGMPLMWLMKLFAMRGQQSLAEMISRGALRWWQREQEQIGARERARLLSHDRYWDGRLASKGK